MITMDQIVREGHPVLRQVAQPVNLPLTVEDKNTLQSMLEFLKNSQDPDIAEKYDLRPGVGLAAPQIGVAKRLFAVHTTDENGKEYSLGIANPKVVSHSVEQNELENGEGCLSVDREIEGVVPRHSRLTVKGFDQNGDPITLRLRGYIAIVFQHELDHLDGIMFYDRIEGLSDAQKRPLPGFAL
ncbi:peptide deformylase [Alkalihalobacillus xiaoxiensis]|uniref:Peptide deformylase n=1 Tax=Shouchella xiaoxiensis TaxID=766895 RepID=A0ABS2SPQ6_9BACI|nr:peptide deformylase [Shouchella xiaoxiensis]MBM7837494.1 peptide deformylase [Shouchella xiaoxiensis]